MDLWKKSRSFFDQLISIFNEMKAAFANAAFFYARGMPHI
ncbi:hypothetical protein BSIN_0966 [Burkholderia singularis]|uniref:Uncharacterized protein n=1 Tax=Burkholderia singularis TaxID=1503053 RepID=A0A238HBW9_9BURK|nr:hypothetical protein BSIN_0966 [Burkholderia singularis]